MSEYGVIYSSFTALWEKIQDQQPSNRFTYGASSFIQRWEKLYHYKQIENASRPLGYLVIVYTHLGALEDGHVDFDGLLLKASKAVNSGTIQT